VGDGVKARATVKARASGVEHRRTHGARVLDRAAQGMAAAPPIHTDPQRRNEREGKKKKKTQRRRRQEGRKVAALAQCTAPASNFFKPQGVKNLLPRVWKKVVGLPRRPPSAFSCRGAA
jgi:hypothetical protein